MTISILGCGWYGKALATALITDGYKVKGSATSTEKLEALTELGIEPFLVNFKSNEENYDPDFFTSDILIISIPPRTRHGEGGDYLPKIQRVVDAALRYNLQNVIYISSTAVYGESCTEVTEADVPEPDTESGRILFDAEKLFYEETAFRTTVIRFGGLVGPGRHPGRFFAGKKDIPNGQAPVNLIHLDDCIGISLSMIQRAGFRCVINAVSPHHPSKAEFYKRSSLQAGLTVLEFIDELGSWKIVNSRLLPGVLHYNFRVPNWDDCIFT